MYSQRAREAGEHGIVVVRILVDSTGNAVNAEIRRANDQNPKPLIEAAAIEAALQSKFAPVERDGRRFGFWITIPFKFIPEVTIDLVASKSEFAMSDTIAVTARITSDVRLDSLVVEMTFPRGPYGIKGIMLGGEGSFPQPIPSPGMGFAASVARRSWSMNLKPGEPVTLSGVFSATSCGSANIRVHCMTSGASSVAAERLLPVCIRGHVGGHLEEYRALARGDTSQRALRVDSRVFAQQADSCCSSLK